MIDHRALAEEANTENKATVIRLSTRDDNIMFLDAFIIRLNCITSTLCESDWAAHTHTYIHTRKSRQPQSSSQPASQPNKKKESHSYIGGGFGAAGPVALVAQQINTGV